MFIRLTIFVRLGHDFSGGEEGAITEVAIRAMERIDALQYCCR